jgi:hypothetical protein
MARNVKVRLCHAFNFIALLIIIQINISGKQEELAEVQYCFQMIVNAKQKTLALMSLHTLPDQEVWNESNETLWLCYYHGDQALKIVDAKMITAVISLAPLPGGPEGSLFLVEKPGLDAAHMGGQDEIVMEG